MIDVGTMAGAGKAVAAGAAAHAGAQGPAAVDEGAFRESLKASVGAATIARTVAAEVPTGARLVRTEGPVAPPAAAGSSADAGGAAVVPVALKCPVVEGSAAVLSAPAAKVLSEDAAGPVTTQAGAASGGASSAVLESLAGAKPVEGSGHTAPAGGAKELKDGVGPAGKKISGKSTEQAVATPGVDADGMSAAAGAVAVVAVPVVVPVAGLVAPIASAGAAAGQMQAAAALVNGSGEVAKVGGSSGAVRTAGRDGKKVDGQASVVGKTEPEAGFALQTAASGGGHLGTKDVVAVPGALSVAGAGAVAPVGVVAGHVGWAGAAGAKAAASVDAVSTAAGQGTAAAGPEVKTLAATPNLLEVGIDGGTHGWLRVRAELGQTGEVTASMVASSAGQADTLRRELPAMSTYLAGESVGVSSLVVNAAGGATGTQDAAMNLGAGTQGGEPDGRAQQGSLGAQSGEPTGGMEGVAGLEFSGAELPAAVYANGSGSWLSVRV